MGRHRVLPMAANGRVDALEPLVLCRARNHRHLRLRQHVWLHEALQHRFVRHQAFEVAGQLLDRLRVVGPAVAHARDVAEHAQDRRDADGRTHIRVALERLLKAVEAREHGRLGDTAESALEPHLRDR